MKLSATLVLASTLLFSATQIQASPFLYTFKGPIIDIDNNGSTVQSAIVDGVPFAVGDPMTYRFVIDFQQSGSCLDPLALPNEQCFGTPIADVPGFDFFFVALNSANKVAPPKYFDIAYNVGVSKIAAGAGLITGESAIFLMSNAIVQDWTVETLTSLATVAMGFDAWNNGIDYYGIISSELTLVSIEPIPEPTPLALFSLGITLLAITRRKTNTWP